MKITEFSKIAKLDASSVLLIDGTTGTKIILAKDAILEMLNLVSPDVHRTIFRGKNLGESLTTAQRNAIQDGTFDDIFLGDYWVIGGITYRVADFDYWLYCGDESFTRHHLLVVPDTSMYTRAMNESNSTTGGYTGSKLYTEGLNQAKQTIKNAFNDAVLQHRERLTNAVTSGRPSGDAWFDSTIELMNENMVYGTSVLTPTSDGSTVPTNYTIDKSQLALFRACPKMMSNGQDFWLRDVVSDRAFAYVTTSGGAWNSPASSERGVRPVFAIG